MHLNDPNQMLDFCIVNIQWYAHFIVAFPGTVSDTIFVQR